MTKISKFLTNEKKNNFITDIFNNSKGFTNIIPYLACSKPEQKIFYRKGTDKIEKIIEYNPQTNYMTKITNFDYFNDKKIKSIEEYEDNIKIKVTTFSLFKSITEYDKKTGKKIRTLNFNQKNNSLLSSIYDYDIVTGKIVRIRVYRENGKHLSFIKEISPQTGLITRCINYKLNSNAIASVSIYNFTDNITTKTTYFYNTPLHVHNIENINNKVVSGKLNNKDLLSFKNNEKIGKLIDNLYKNRKIFVKSN